MGTSKLPSHAYWCPTRCRTGRPTYACRAREGLATVICPSPLLGGNIRQKRTHRHVLVQRNPTIPRSGTNLASSARYKALHPLASRAVCLANDTVAPVSPQSRIAQVQVMSLRYGGILPCYRNDTVSPRLEVGCVRRYSASGDLG